MLNTGSSFTVRPRNTQKAHENALLSMKETWRFLFLWCKWNRNPQKVGMEGTRPTVRHHRPNYGCMEASVERQMLGHCLMCWFILFFLRSRWSWFYVSGWRSATHQTLRELRSKLSPPWSIWLVVFFWAKFPWAIGRVGFVNDASNHAAQLDSLSLSLSLMGEEDRIVTFCERFFTVVTSYITHSFYLMNFHFYLTSHFSKVGPSREAEVRKILISSIHVN